MNDANQPNNLLEGGGADAVLAEYMLRLDRGEVIDRAALLAAHPELADELGAYFADCDDVAQFTGGAAPFAARLIYPAPSPHPRSLLPGTPPGPLPRLDNYEVLEELARGGMGVIYKARQFLGEESPRASRIVALKMIRGGELAAPEDVRRFHREAAAVANLDHPHIVPIYEVGQQDGQHFFSMKLMEGGSLAQRMAEYRLPICKLRTHVDAEGNIWSPFALDHRKAVLATLVATIARAVHYAHQRGLIHRDLKPANILLDEAGQPHVTDFGLAKRIHLTQPPAVNPGHPLTQSGEIVGTPNYMSPEQARARDTLSTATDVYSLGAIFYELLTGQPPFREATPVATLVELLDKEPPLPRLLNPVVDRDLEIICLKCLRKEPDERYPSAEALAEDLERWQRGEPIRARAVGHWERMRKWVRRRPALAATLLASATVALLGVAGVSLGFATARSGLEVSNQSLYYSHIGLAKYERLHSIFRALEHLERCEPFRRRWEWHYLKRLCQCELLTLEGHRGAVIGVAYHPQGHRLASAGADRTIRIWEASTGKLLHVFPEQDAAILHLAYSPDGTVLAAACENGHLSLRHAESGLELAVLRGHEKAATCVVFNRAGSKLASASEDGTVRLWDLATRMELDVVMRENEPVSSVAWSADGHRLAMASWGGRVRVWDVQQGKEVFTHVQPQVFWTGVAFSPDGERLAACSNVGHVLVFEATGKPGMILRGGFARWIHAVTFHPDGRQLALSGDDGTVQIWDLLKEDVQLAFVLRGHERRANGLAYSPDGNRLASASTDGTVRVWDARNDPEMALLTGHTAPVTALSYGPDGAWLASASADQTMRITDPHTRQVLRVFSGLTVELSCLVVTADGRQLLGGGTDGVMRIYDAATGEVLRHWPAHSASICGVGLRARESELCTVDTNGTVRLWDLATGQLQRELPAKTGPLTAAALSGNGRTLALARKAEPGRPIPPIQFWDLQTDRVVQSRTSHQGVVTGLAFDPRDRLASVSYDRTTRIWDTTTGEEVLVLARNNLPELAVAFSPDGGLLATGGRDKRVRIYHGGQK